MMQKHYNRANSGRAIVLYLWIVIAVAAGFLIGKRGCHAAEETVIRCWAVCKPGSHVDIHSAPDKDSRIEGRLDPCDSFLTDGVSRNGYIRVLDVGEGPESWIYSGYVVTEKPEELHGERYISVSKGKLFCRKWIGGPKISGRIGYLQNCESVQVFYMADGWAVTNRGYIRSEWLEVDPQ